MINISTTLFSCFVIGVVDWSSLSLSGARVEDGGEKDFGDYGEGATVGDFVAVKQRAGEESGDGEEDCEGGDGEAPLPAFVVFDPDDEGDGDEAAGGEAEDEVVEESRALFAAFGGGIVELLGAVGREGAFDAADAKRGEVEPDEEHCGLAAGGFLAGGEGGGGARWRL